MSYTDFPTEKAWDDIYQGSNFPKILKIIGRLHIINQVESGPMGDLRDLEIQDLQKQLRNRMTSAARSYIMLVYYFRKGIPDDEWYMSPSKDEKASLEFLPHFEEKDFYTKDWFDFFLEIFYYKYFSAWDTIAHILNKKYGLGFKERGVYINKIIERLATENTMAKLSKDLKTLRTNDAFKKAKKIRDDFTHNYLPSTPGRIAIVEEDKQQGITTGYFGALGNYVPTKEIIDNVEEVLNLFVQAIVILGHEEIRDCE